MHCFIPTALAFIELIFHDLASMVDNYQLKCNAVLWLSCEQEKPSCLNIWKML